MKTTQNTSMALPMRIVAFPKEFQKHYWTSLDKRMLTIFVVSALSVYIPLLAISSRPKAIPQMVNNSILIKIAKANRIDASVIKEYEDKIVKDKVQSTQLNIKDTRPKIPTNPNERTIRMNHAKLIAQNRAKNATRNAEAQGILKIATALTDHNPGVYKSFSFASTSSSLDAVLDQMTSLTSTTEDANRSALSSNAVSNRSESLAFLNSLLSDEEQESISAVKGIHGEGIILMTKSTFANTNSSGTSAVDIQSVIDAQAMAINSCYQKELKKSPEMKGKLSVTIKINAAGKVAGVTPMQNTIGEAVSQCIVNKIRSWSFPKGKKGVLTVNQTFVFTK